jgi:transcriptional regulator with XRE-family HTH domain
MSIELGQIQEMKNKAYRHGAVNAQIEVDLPLQIRALRKQRNWTQPELASIAEMKQPRISKMEKVGETRFSLETLRRLAEAFDVALVVRFATFGELLDWSDRFSPDDFRVPSFEQEVPELEARSNRSSSAATTLGSGAELQARPTEIPLDEARRAELLSRPRNQQQGPPHRIPPGAAEMAMARQA